MTPGVTLSLSRAADTYMQPLACLGTARLTAPRAKYGSRLPGTAAPVHIQQLRKLALYPGGS